MKRAILLSTATALLTIALLPGLAMAHGKPGFKAPATVTTTTTTTTQVTTVHPRYLALHNAYRQPWSKQTRPQHHRHHGHYRQTPVASHHATPDSRLRIHIGYELKL